MEGKVGLSGEDQIVQLEIDLLRSRGHDVVDLRRYSSGFSRSLKHFQAHTIGNSFRLDKALDNLKADVIHCYNLNLQSGYSWLSKVKTPVVSSLHNFRSICPIAISWRNGELCFKCRDFSNFQAISNHCSGMYGTLGAIRRTFFDRNNLVLRGSAHIIATSTKMAREIAKSSHTSVKNISVLGSVSRFPRRIVNRKVGGGFVYLGRFAPEKGVVELVENWSSNERLVMIGSGPLEEKLKMAAVGKNIQFRAPDFSSSGEFLDDFEALVFPSTWLEGSPLVIYEAMSLSLPVLFDPISSASEILEDGLAGVPVLDFGNSREVEKSISLLRSNYDTFQSNSYSLSESKYSQENWITSLERILDTAISG